MTETMDYEKVISNRELFNQVMYTKISEALKLLEERQKDLKLLSKVEKLLNGQIPDLFKKHKKCAILFRQVATPNNETKRFVSLAEEYGLHPLIFEYHNDIFSPDNNTYKHSLGKLSIHKLTTKEQHQYVKECITIVDFNKYKGKKIKEVLTNWSEPLVDFHKSLFSSYFNDKKVTTWDASDFYKSKKIVNAFEHYKYLFLFFICHGILFENFLTSKGNEVSFTKNVVLPAFDEVTKTVGIKPLVVPIEPIEIEQDEYWEYYDNSVKKLVKERENLKK